MLSTEKVEGKTLRELIDANPDKLDEYLGMLIDAEIEVHSHVSLLLTSQKDKYARMIDQVEFFDDATRYDLHMRLRGMPHHKKVCHGDFSPSNVIITEDGPVVCDWAHATSGNGAADAATSYLLFRMNGEDELAERYLNLYCERAGADKQYVQSWLSIVAAAELARGRMQIERRQLFGADLECEGLIRHLRPPSPPSKYSGPRRARYSSRSTPWQWCARAGCSPCARWPR